VTIIEIEIALGCTGSVVEVVHHLGHERLHSRLVEAAHLADDAAVLGYDIERSSAGDRSHVGGRLGVDPAEPHRGDRASGGSDRAAPIFGSDASVRRASLELGDQAVVGRRSKRDLTDRRGVIEHVAEPTREPTHVEGGRALE
jgi:hypothetical protein